MFPWLHPSIVHFAIGLTFSGVLLDVVALWRMDERLQLAGAWNTGLGAVATLVAVVSGLRAEATLGPHSGLGDALLQFHRIFGIGTAIGAVLMLGMRAYMRGRILPRTRTAYLTVSFLTLAFALITGGFGGNLVYRYGLGIEPSTARAVLDAQPPPDTVVAP